jgi:hypothetical protein
VSGGDVLLAVKTGVGIGVVLILVGTARTINEGLTHHIRRWFGLPDDSAD